MKGLLKVCVWEGVGDRTETAIFWPPLLRPSTLCLSHSPGLLNRRPRGPLSWVICCTLSATSLHPNSIGGPEPLWPGVGGSICYDNCGRIFFYIIIFQFYISPIVSQSSAQFMCGITLEWHFWPGRRPKYNTRTKMLLLNLSVVILLHLSFLMFSYMEDIYSHMQMRNTPIGYITP